MGGIPTNEFCEVQNETQAVVPGLFACGEVAAASLHGLNRLGTNSLLELITLGRVAGERVVAYLKDAKDPAGIPSEAGDIIFNQFSTYLTSGGKENHAQIRDTLRSRMMEKVGIFRTEASLLEAIETLKELRERAQRVQVHTTSLATNQELWQIWELNNLIAVSMVIAYGALERKESRGAHFREDYPERSDEFNYHTLACMPEFGKVIFSKRPIDMSIFEEKGERSELFDYIERKY
jgi:succinate dehydrogenase / fumarate reductase flavoprotein subunit